MQLARTTLCVLLAPVVLAHGAVYSPRVLSPHNADTYSLNTFAQFTRWRDLQGDAKVFEIFKYLTDRRTGIYPMGVPAWEGSETLAEFGAVTDPVKMLNVYPIGHCGTLGPTAAGILEGMGIGSARTLIIPGWNHVASEVFYDSQWHYVDLDVRAVFRRADGSLASMAEARADASLWSGPNSPHFFPLDSLQTVREVYAKTTVDHRYGVASGGHTMDFALRRGETFIRWWKPQEDRWNQHSSYAVKPFPRNIIERAPRGPKCKHESFTVHTHGNGRFVYKPNLTTHSADFEDGAYDFRNVEPGASGLTLKSPGEGYAIFEVHSPYVIVPRVGDLDTTADDREASVVTLDATGADLSLSLDNGLTWQKLEAVQGTVDLTSKVSGQYGYLLKIQLRGEPQKAVVRSLEMTTWVQVHPASLPALRKGKNTMRLVTGDHYGLQTRVMAVQPDTANRDDLLRCLVEPPKDYDPARRTSRVRGSIVATVQAPPGTKIAWFSAGASFAAQVGAPNRTSNSISYATDSPRDFVEVYRAALPPDQSHWHYNVDREVKLARPAREVFVRYLGEPALNNIRIFAHCLEDRPRGSAAVVVTHAWSENGARKIKQVKIEGEYEIVTEAEPEDEFIELAVPTSARLAEKLPAERTAQGEHSEDAALRVARQAPTQARLQSPPAKLAEFFAPPEQYRSDLGGFRSPLVFEEGTRVQSPADWQRRREEILSAWHKLMGPWPPLIERPRVEVVGTTRRENITQQQVRIEIAPGGELVDALLLLPDEALPARKHPAVLVVYYDAETGVGLGAPLRDYGWQLARRGFVALSVGKPNARIDLTSTNKPRTDPYLGPVGKPVRVQPLSALAWAAANAHTVLAQRSDVDPARIGIVGHSFGGKWAMFASCLYDKFACAVWSDPGSVFDERDRRKQNPSGSVNYWDVWYLGFEPGAIADPKNAGPFRKLPSEGQPRTGAYKALIEGGHDLVELHALMAPRPFLVSGGTADLPERWPALNHSIAVNKVLGCDHRVAMTTRDGHSPTEAANEQVYRFFEWCMGDPK